MKTQIVILISLYTTLLSCTNSKNINGELTWEKVGNNIELTLNNNSETNYYFSFKSIRGTLIENDNTLSNLFFLSLSLDSTKIKNNWFNLKVLAFENYKKASKGTIFENPILPIVRFRLRALPRDATGTHLLLHHTGCAILL